MGGRRPHPHHRHSCGCTYMTCDVTLSVMAGVLGVTVGWPPLTASLVIEVYPPRGGDGSDGGGDGATVRVAYVQRHARGVGLSAAVAAVGGGAHGVPRRHPLRPALLADVSAAPCARPLPSSCELTITFPCAALVPPPSDTCVLCYHQRLVLSDHQAAVFRERARPG